MKIRTVLFDIYNTLLQAGPPPPDAEARWTALWHGTFEAKPRLTLESFVAEASRIIAHAHAAALPLGVAHPEVFWNAVAKEVLPELDRLDEAALEEFLFAHARLQRDWQLAPGAARVLQLLADRGVPVGLASNCQPYTLFELAAALEGSDFALGNFQPDLCFLSYKHGFSKPDPHVFRLLAARLKARGIEPGETLTVGDRLDNDIEPARTQGFQTWHLVSATPGTIGAGDWSQLADFLSAADG